MNDEECIHPQVIFRENTDSRGKKRVMNSMHKPYYYY
jgi:hypothetical protein